MSDPATTSMLHTLIPVIVGGVIGVAGSPLVHWLQSRTDKTKRRREKFEELVSTLHEYDHWLNTQRNIRVFGEKGVSTVSPMAKVQAIVSVYFPEFEKQLAELDREGDKYELWMLTAAQKRLNGEKDYAADQKVAFSGYVEKKHSLLKELRDYAKRELQ